MLMRALQKRNISRDCAIIVHRFVVIQRDKFQSFCRVLERTIFEKEERESKEKQGTEKVEGSGVSKGR